MSDKKNKCKDCKPIGMCRWEGIDLDAHEECFKPKPKATRPQDSSGSAEFTGCKEKDILMKLTYRIMAAGSKGRGCRITAEEAGLLRYYNLPCTADDPSVGDNL